MFFLRDVLLSSPVICVALHEAIRTESFLVRSCKQTSVSTIRSYFSHRVVIFFLLDVLLSPPIVCVGFRETMPTEPFM